MYRVHEGKLQVLLVHPGGPYFEKKDDDAWSIPKGEVDHGEDLLECAKREFFEETGFPPTGPFIPLTPITQKGGKIVHAWASEGDCDPSAVVSNTFKMEWPPWSGKQTEFPEIDRAEFFDVATARRKIKAAQTPLVEELKGILNAKTSGKKMIRFIPAEELKTKYGGLHGQEHKQSSQKSTKPSSLMWHRRGGRSKQPKCR